jgi:ligand-binding SRPBCC domain-containing protein
MKDYVIEKSTWIARPISTVFPFFSDAENLARITPPELGFRIRSALPIHMSEGTLIDYTIVLFGLPVRWRTEITRWNPPHSFEDRQLSGPYAKWVHTHTFVEARGGTTMHDRVVYALPFGLVGRLAHPLVRRQLKHIFDYRESVLVREFR